MMIKLYPLELSQKPKGLNIKNERLFVRTGCTLEQLLRTITINWLDGVSMGHRDLVSYLYALKAIELYKLYLFFSGDYVQRDRVPMSFTTEALYRLESLAKMIQRDATRLYDKHLETVLKEIQIYQQLLEKYDKEIKDKKMLDYDHTSKIIEKVLPQQNDRPKLPISTQDSTKDADLIELLELNVVHDEKGYEPESLQHSYFAYIALGYHREFTYENAVSDVISHAERIPVDIKLRLIQTTEE